MWGKMWGKINLINFSEILSVPIALDLIDEIALCTSIPDVLVKENWDDLGER